MNWIERLYDIQKLGRKDLYSQNGEGLYLEAICHLLLLSGHKFRNDISKKLLIADFGGGDGLYLSNTRHLATSLPQAMQIIYDREVDYEINLNSLPSDIKPHILSIDLDGNDYWILEASIVRYRPDIIVAEFNAAFTDSRAIKYNQDHVWDGTDYYGFSFEAGKKLAEANGYKVIFQNDNLNMYMVREDLIKVPIPPVTFEQTKSFPESNRTDWVWI